jgi:hypothetical protein
VCVFVVVCVEGRLLGIFVFYLRAAHCGVSLQYSCLYASFLFVVVFLYTAISGVFFVRSCLECNGAECNNCFWMFCLLFLFVQSSV